MTRALRLIALAIATAATIDPGLEVRRPAPVDVQVKTDGSAAADALADRVKESAPPFVRFDPGPNPQAVVIVGDRADPASADAAIPVSAIVPSASPDVRVHQPDSVPALVIGQAALLEAPIEAAGMGGRSTPVVLEQDGVELTRVEQRWTGESSRSTIRLPFVPSTPGFQVLRVSAVPADDEARVDDNAVYLGVDVRTEPLQVLVYEPRPTWSAGFVRRALEGEPMFAVASLQRSSRGIRTEAGAPPRSLTLERLERYEAVVIGAPEDLTSGEVLALDAYCAIRGGTVVYLPDRRPTGPYVAALGGLTEVLLERPVALETGQGPRLQASELAAFRKEPPGAHPLARLADGSAVVVSWPQGEGRILFSGALDAWRYRAANGNGFARFWQRAVSTAALAAPPRVAVAIPRAVVAPGTVVSVAARVRPTEFTGGKTVTGLPPIAAEVAGPDTHRETIRLWPAAEPGTFRGSFTAHLPGRHRVRVRLGDETLAERAVLVDARAPRHELPDLEALRLLASSTGGVFTEGDVQPVLDHLRNLARQEVTVTIHPMRSGWWIVPFAAALCAEWTIRRRRGVQ